MDDYKMVYNRLIGLGRNGADRDDLVNELRMRCNKGYELSDDKSLMVGHFDNGLIIISEGGIDMYHTCEEID